MILLLKEQPASRQQRADHDNPNGNSTDLMSFFAMNRNCLEYFAIIEYRMNIEDFVCYHILLYIFFFFLLSKRSFMSGIFYALRRVTSFSIVHIN